MTKQQKCMLAETIGECVLGGAIATCLNKTVMDKCNGGEKALVVLGGMVLSFTAGRAFGKAFYKFCDDTFDTDFEDMIERL